MDEVDLVNMNGQHYQPGSEIGDSIEHSAGGGGVGGRGVAAAAG